MRKLLLAGLLGTGFTLPMSAQQPDTTQWNDSITMSLVKLGIEHRAKQMADTALVDYKAQAHGYLTFLAQLGQGFPEPPKIIKADELALDVYWKAPRFSKQLIHGRRDTLLLPTDIRYHRDHLGIVQNNFPNIIRLGDGDEVEDVPHPLSPEGMLAYDFAIRDSLQIRLPHKTLDVYEVRVRPKDDRKAAAIGAVYIDKASGEVVRMAFSFTRVALKDKDLEDVSVVLENGLIEGRFWLPYRQEIEIRRSGSFLDYPARGIIRGRWEICCYEVNTGISDQFFGGPEIVLAPRPAGSPPMSKDTIFKGRLLDSLPADVRAVTDADVSKVQDEARELVRAQALARTRSFTLSARRISDFVRFNRVEGMAFGFGATQRLGSGFSIGGNAAYGVSDTEWKGTGMVALRRASGAGVIGKVYRSYQDIGVEQERSTLFNSFAAQEFASDYTNMLDVRGASVTFQSPTTAAWNGSLEAAYEHHDSSMVYATPANGTFRGTVPALGLRQIRLTARAERPTRLTFFGLEANVKLELTTVGYTTLSKFDDSTTRYVNKLNVSLHLEKPVGDNRFVAHTIFSGVEGRDSVPVQYLAFAGGPVSAPGFEYHQLSGRVFVSQRLEWQSKIPFFSISLGRYGRAPGSITLAPYASMAHLSKPNSLTTTPMAPGWYPSVGLGVLSFFNLFRFDVARGFGPRYVGYPAPGRWTFSVDVAREFWSIL